VGLRLEARGIMAPMGSSCEIMSTDGHRIEAEVVGFNDKTLYLMPLTDPVGIGPGASVRVSSDLGTASLGPELLGRVIDGRGEPLDGKPKPVGTSRLSLLGLPLNPMERGPIDSVLDVGVKAINGLLTLGRGQRIGLVAGSGVGKSVLLGMMTRFTKADVVVIGLIGERGREVQAFIQESLGEVGLAKSVVVAAPANVSPVLRLKAAQMTHVIAEYFRDQGLNVLMLVDSLTRVAHAQREIGLAIGEPPTAKGYPPSVFALLPNLIERAGVGRHGHGSITAIYTVLAEGDDANDPIVDIARASLDGQVMLSRKLADAAHYPAIDLNGSISRVMQNLLNPEDLKAANRFRRMWSLYQQNQDLIQVGAYETGTNPTLDEAIRLRDAMENFLRQDMHLGEDETVTRDSLRALLAS
jgi:flagellum-specific ATP synthase